MSRLDGRLLIGGAAAACAACCAAPIIGALGVVGFAATGVALAFAGAVFAAVVGALTLGALLVRRARARRRGECAVPAGGGSAVPVTIDARPGAHGEVDGETAH